MPITKNEPTVGLVTDELTDVVLSGTSKSRGVVYLTAAGFYTLAANDTYYPWSGTFASGILQNFTHNGTGLLTYTGSATRVFLASYAGLNRCSSTSLSNFSLSINGDVPAAEIVRTARLAGTHSMVSFTVSITLSQGDTIQPVTSTPSASGATMYFDPVCGLTISE